jgi:hypothetical protein
VRSEYRIEYSIQQADDDGDFVEIGFGSSGSASDLEDAVYAIESYVGNWYWETSEGMPDPRDVRADIEHARAWSR